LKKYGGKLGQGLQVKKIGNACLFNAAFIGVDVYRIGSKNGDQHV
jgi:hypothetical protein